MGRLKNWWSRFAGTAAGAAAHRPPPEARFTEIGTSYPSASSTNAPVVTPAPNPYAAYPGEGTRTPRRNPIPTPGAPPAWGTPANTSAAPAAAPAATPGPAPTPSTPPVPTARPARTGRRSRTGTGVTFGALSAAVITVVVIVIGLIVGVTQGGGTGGSGSGPPGGYAPELEADWTLSSQQLLGDYGAFDSPEGSLSGTVLETTAGWIVMLEASTLEARLVSVAPDSGDVQWSIPMPEARCTTSTGDALVCLTRSGGSTFELVTVDASSGAPVGDPVPTDIAHVPVFVVPMGDDGLTAFTMRSELIGLDLQGNTMWREELDTGDYETEWIQPDVARLGPSTILFLGTYVGTVQVDAQGPHMHECRSVAVTEQAWMCTGEDDAVGRDADGAELWREGWQDYYLVDRYQHIAPVIIVDNWDGTVSGVDPLTGTHGALIEVSDDPGASFNFLGDPEHPFVFADDTVSLLDADLTTVLWTSPIEDEYLNIAGGGLAGDTLAIDAQHSYGFDLDTGEMQWERAFLPNDALVVGEAFVGMQGSDLIRYQLP
ncbi:hypothetical protein [Pseudactinotalea sp.]|uniref:hypothetical protein n=1 Tax=Pseudactinotalea sp. TaxID=1926260 RepID=UPI003B3ABEEE